jgi:hypothetical protein
MSTTPPEPPPPTYNLTVPARLPVPGNAEFLVYLLVEILFAILWAATDDVTSAVFCTLTAATTVGYLISRGIAKASRVLEQ